MSAKGDRNENTEESSAFFANNDAASYNTRYLRSIRNKERFQELHFYQCSVKLLDELFPKHPQKGTLDPPTAFRRSAVALGQWREMDQEEQSSILELEKQGAHVKEGDAGNELKRSVEAGEPESTDAPASKVLKGEESKMDSVPDRWESSSHDLDVDFCKKRICRGVNIAFLRTSFPKEISKLEGFAVLVGDAMQFKANAYKNGNSWPFASDPRVVGAVVEETSAEDGSHAILLKWICIQLDEATTNSTKVESVHFHHPTCTRDSSSVVCENCKLHALDLVNLCAVLEGT